MEKVQIDVLRGFGGELVASCYLDLIFDSDPRIAGCHLDDFEIGNFTPHSLADWTEKRALSLVS